MKKINTKSNTMIKYEKNAAVTTYYDIPQSNMIKTNTNKKVSLKDQSYFDTMLK